jgi:hypothetical protein
VVALGYLLGVADGPIVIVVGGLALVALGRSVADARTDALIGALALAVLGGALGIPALRWQVFELSGLRDVQAVLGPTVLVGPTPVAAAGWVAMGAGVVSLGALPGIRARNRAAWMWLTAELLVGALAVVTVFYGPAIEDWGSSRVPEPASGLALWAAAVGTTTAASMGVAIAARRMPARVRAGVVIAGALAVIVAAGVIVGILYR